jgi:flavorubredoxin
MPPSGPTVTEIAPELFRISVYVPEIRLQFNHFLVRDEQPLLFHAGLRRMFPLVREGVASVIDPARLAYIGFSHFESDECGALNDWLAAAPRAVPVFSDTGVLVNLNDFADREPRPLADGDLLETGRFRFRLQRTPHLPHGWDACVLFEETERTLLCSDLFHQNGDVEAVTGSDVVGRARAALREYQSGVPAEYMPYTRQTAAALEKLAGLGPRTLAIMHGSSFNGDCAGALRDYGDVLREVFGTVEDPPAAPEVGV